MENIINEKLHICPRTFALHRYMPNSLNGVVIFLQIQCYSFHFNHSIVIVCNEEWNNDIQSNEFFSSAKGIGCECVCIFYWQVRNVLWEVIIQELRMWNMKALPVSALTLNWIWKRIFPDSNEALKSRVIIPNNASATFVHGYCRTTSFWQQFYSRSLWIQALHAAAEA